MAPRMKSQRYENVATEIEDDDHQTSHSSQPRRHYTPVAIKAPTLISFVLALAACLVLTELIIRRASPELPENEPSRRLVRRRNYGFQQLGGHVEHVLVPTCQSHSSRSAATDSRSSALNQLHRRDSSTVPVPTSPVVVGVTSASSSLPPSAIPPTTTASLPASPTSVSTAKTLTVTSGGLVDLGATTTTTLPVVKIPGSSTTQPPVTTSRAAFTTGLIDLGATTTARPITTGQIDLGATTTSLPVVKLPPTTSYKTLTSGGQIDLGATTTSLPVIKVPPPTTTPGDQGDRKQNPSQSTSTDIAAPTKTSGGLLDPNATKGKQTTTSDLPRIKLPPSNSATVVAPTTSANPKGPSLGNPSITSGNYVSSTPVDSNMIAVETSITTMVTTTDAYGHVSSYPAIAVYTTMVPATPMPTMTPPPDSTSVSLYDVETSITTMVTTTDADGHVTSFMAIAVYTTQVSTSPIPKPSPSSTTLDPAATSDLYPIQKLNEYEEIVEGKVSHFSYFAALYLPALLGVILKMYWEIVFAAFKMMEPFEQLYKIGGDLAKQTLFAQYLSNSLSFDALKSLFRGSLLPTLSSSVYMLVIILAPLSAASMTVKARAMCEVAPGKYHRCIAAWVVDTFFLRALEVVLATCIFFTLLVLYFSWSYKNGLSSAPSSIASVAALFNDHQLIRKFRGTDPDCDAWTLASAFRHQYCRLGYHKNVSGNHYYGIECRNSEFSDQDPILASESETGGWKARVGGYSSVPNPGGRDQPSPPWFNLSNLAWGRLLDFLQFFSSLALFGVILGYTLDNKKDPFNDFFNSGTFWPRFSLVSMASIVDMFWKRLEREVRITEPYRRLAQRYAAPETTILITLHGTPWSELPKCFPRLLRYPYMGYSTLITVIAALSDINIIATAGVPFSDGQTTIGLRVCIFLTLTITGIMTLTMVFTMLWWRRGVVARIPRCPETIGDVLSYLCASQMTKDFSSGQYDGLSQRERDRKVIQSGRRFWFGRMVGEDGVERWAVDYEDAHGKAEITSGLEPMIDTEYRGGTQQHQDWSYGDIPPVQQAGAVRILSHERS